MSEEGPNLEQDIDNTFRTITTQAIALGRMVAQLREQRHQRAIENEQSLTAELNRRHEAERQRALITLNQADHDGWWNTASSERVASAVATAQVWKDKDPQIAKLASRLDDRARARWGMSPSNRIAALTPQQRQAEAQSLVMALNLDDLEYDDPLRTFIDDVHHAEQELEETQEADQQRDDDHSLETREQSKDVPELEDESIMSEQNRNDKNPTDLEAIIQQSSQDWWNDHDLEDAHLGGFRDYAQDQAWLQVLRPALNKVADVPGFDREQVDIEDPIYTDNATTLMLHPSSSGPSGPDAVILSATDEQLEIRESGHNPETLTSAEAAERLGVSRESFQQAVDHIKTPLQNMSTAYQGIVDRIDQRARDEAHTDSVHQQGPDAEETIELEQDTAIQHETPTATAASSRLTETQQDQFTEPAHSHEQRAEHDHDVQPQSRPEITRPRQQEIEDFELFMRSSGMDERTVEARLFPEHANAKPPSEALNTKPNTREKSKNQSIPGMNQERNTERGR